MVFQTSFPKSNHCSCRRFLRRLNNIMWVFQVVCPHSRLLQVVGLLILPSCVACEFAVKLSSCFTNRDGDESLSVPMFVAVSREQVRFYSVDSLLTDKYACWCSLGDSTITITLIHPVVSLSLMLDKSHMVAKINHTIPNLKGSRVSWKWYLGFYLIVFPVWLHSSAHLKHSAFTHFSSRQGNDKWGTSYHPSF